MSINIRNAYEYLDDNYSTAIAILLTGLLVIGSFGLVFGIYCLLGWLLFAVWQPIAWELNLPQFNYWTAVGVVAVIKLILGKSRVISTKSDPD